MEQELFFPACGQLVMQYGICEEIFQCTYGRASLAQSLIFTNSNLFGLKLKGQPDVLISLPV